MRKGFLWHVVSVCSEEQGGGVQSHLSNGLGSTWGWYHSELVGYCNDRIYIYHHAVPRMTCLVYLVIRDNSH